MKRQTSVHLPNLGLLCISKENIDCLETVLWFKTRNFNSPATVCHTRTLRFELVYFSTKYMSVTILIAFITEL